MGSVLKIVNLCKEYKMGVLGKTHKALSNLYLKVRQGEVFGFLGPNGAGKSTTIKLILDLIKPTTGEVFLFDEKHYSRKTKARIGYLPELAQYNDYLTPRELLTMYGKIFGMNKEQINARIEELLSLVKMSDRIDDRIKTFSKGMVQRIGIAQALLNDPELLILDEPASGLDPVGRKEIRDIIKALKQQGKTIFFSSHELTEVENLCDRAAILKNGQLIKIGELSDLIPYSKGYEFTAYGFSLDDFKSNYTKSFRSESNTAGDLKIRIEEIDTPYEVINIIKQLNGTLISSQRIRPSLEQAFMQIIDEQSAEETV